jgi:alkyl hydroperoxide reductase subunit F
MKKRKADTKKLIDDKTKKELKPILEALKNPVKIIFFAQKKDCPTCDQELSLLKELSNLTDKLELKTYDLILNGDEAMKYKIDKVPATVIMGEKDYGIRFFGMTTGYEFTSLLEAIVMVSIGGSGLEPEIEALVRTIKEPVHLQVMTTLTCPFCPKMVHTAHQFAFINENIRSDMIEGAEFPELVQKYDVSGVPKTIINEVHSFEGAYPAPAAFMKVLEAVNPQEFRKLDEAIRELQGARKAKPAEEGYEYEVLIVGGGPAALSAALYTTRKGLDTALIANKFGGQITYTATIENYLGFPQIGGQDMNTLFRNHMENYQVAEVLGINVTSVTKKDKGFIARTEDGRNFKARSIIYCAGKEYKRLGVPGEDKFIGKSIGFCATCDAPLYSGKKVAIVGGGNSAFTSARDLLHYAFEIHLIHRRNEFRADEAIVKEIIDAENVIIHTPMEVESFLGDEKLTGVRLVSPDKKENMDIEIDGVFLEIGLTPNTDPVKDIMKLNKWGEVPIKKDQSTNIPGFFAAGDVTDVSEKQISIAVGDGAKAALGAHKYLVENKLTQSTVGIEESWQ